jgi:hypothetical protein
MQNFNSIPDILFEYLQQLKTAVGHCVVQCSKPTHTDFFDVPTKQKPKCDDEEQAETLPPHKSSTFHIINIGQEPMSGLLSACARLSSLFSHSPSSCVRQEDIAAFCIASATSLPREEL